MFGEPERSQVNSPNEANPSKSEEKPNDFNRTIGVCLTTVIEHLNLGEFDYIKLIAHIRTDFPNAALDV